MRLTAELYSTILASLRAGEEDSRLTDRRDNPRVGLRVRLTVIAPRAGGAGAMEVSVRDLSRTGICLVAAEPLVVGSEFVAYLPGGKSDPLAVRYEVRHCTPVGSGRMRIGAEFKGIVARAAAGDGEPASNAA